MAPATVVAILDVNETLPDLEPLEHIISGLAELPVHPDVVAGLRSLREAGVRVPR